jgi:hypothetical protein
MSYKKLRDARMKRVLLCLLAVTVVFVFSSSRALADCPDKTYRCML